MSLKYVPSMRSPWVAILLLLLIVSSLWSLGPSFSPFSSSTTEVEVQHNVLSETPGYTNNKEPDPAAVKTSLDKIPNAQPPAATGVAAAKLEYERPLITYVYAESDVARENLEFFFAHGLHANADFIFIFNTPSNLTEKVPKASNIQIVERDNSCFDLGSHAEILKKDNLYKKYKRFILMNASIRGPFLPYWSQDCWTDMYLGRITEKNKLVGMTSNCWPQFHIQSMIWATDIIGLELLLQPQGIGKCFNGWQEAVNAETGSTHVILEAGYTAMPMMAMFHADEEHFIANCDTTKNGDMLFDKKYDGTNVHPYETIFMKTNRDVDPVGIERLTHWHNQRNYSSYDFCHQL